MDEESIEKVKKIKNYDYLDVSYDLALKNKREKKRVWNTERDPYFKMNIMVLELWKKKRLFYIKTMFLKNIINKVFKTVVSKKVNDVFYFFLNKRKRRPKIYFRVPFIYEVRYYGSRKKRKKPEEQFTSLRITKLFLYNI